MGTAILKTADRRRLEASFFDQDIRSHALCLRRVVRQGVTHPWECWEGHPLEEDLVDFSRQAMQSLFHQYEGVVYGASVPGKPGWLKVGQTRQSVWQRAKALRSELVVGEVFVFWEVATADRYWLETALHQDLKRQGQHLAKELFLADPETVAERARCLASEDQQRWERLGISRSLII